MSIMHLHAMHIHVHIYTTHTTYIRALAWNAHNAHSCNARYAHPSQSYHERHAHPCHAHLCHAHVVPTNDDVVAMPFHIHDLDAWSIHVLPCLCHTYVMQWCSRQTTDTPAMCMLIIVTLMPCTFSQLCHAHVCQCSFTFMPYTFMPCTYDCAWMCIACME